MLHIITKRLEICIEISKVDYYTRIFTFSLQIAYVLLSQSRKLKKRGGT